MDEAKKSAASTVLDALSSADFRAAMRAITNDRGEHPIIVATGHETIESVFARFRDESDAFVAVPVSSTLIEILALSRSDTPPHGVELDDLPVAPEASIGMLVDYMRAHPGGYRVRVEAHLSLELLARGEPVSA